MRISKLKNELKILKIYNSRPYDFYDRIINIWMSKYLLILCICIQLAVSASPPRCSDYEKLDESQLW